MLGSSLRAVVPNRSIPVEPAQNSKSLLHQPRIPLDQAARELMISRATIWRWSLLGIDGRLLPTIKVGGRRFVLVSDLEAFLDAGKCRVTEGRP